MPIYTYRCENCGVQFEKQQSFSDQSLTRCPECNHKSLRKVYQPVGIVFKGSGFYATDHRSPSGTSRSGGKSEESKSEESKSGDKPVEKESKQEKIEKSEKGEKSESSGSKEE